MLAFLGHRRGLAVVLPTRNRVKARPAQDHCRVEGDLEKDQELSNALGRHNHGA